MEVTIKDRNEILDSMKENGMVKVGKYCDWYGIPKEDGLLSYVTILNIKEEDYITIRNYLNSNQDTN